MLNREAKAILKNIKTEYSVLKRKLPRSVNGITLSEKSKLPFKLKILEGTLLHRICSLTKEAIVFYRKNKILQGIILSRSIHETVAVFFMLSKKIENLKNEKDIKQIDNYLMNCLFGCRIEPLGDTKFIHINDALRILEKAIPGSQKSYDIMSEYVHLNGAGTYASFGKMIEEKAAFYFGPRKDKQPIGLGALYASLMTANMVLNKLNDTFPKFVELSENSVSNGI